MIKLLLNRPYLPEGRNESYRKNAEALLTVSDAKKYCREETPLEMTVARCDAKHDLYGTIGPFPAVIRRSEAISAAVSGAEKEIAVLSLVGKTVCCTIRDICSNDEGQTLLELSRRGIQDKALSYLLDTVQEGDVIPASVSSMAPIGVFADVGCGIIALLPIRQISVSRIQHPAERFSPHQPICAAVRKIDRAAGRLLLTHKELLGTWAENAAQFQAGETITGVVRGIKSYGVFIELTPNLTGLAETDDTLQEGERVSVLIKALLPDKHKIKLHVIGQLPACPAAAPLQYKITEGNISGWSYY